MRLILCILTATLLFTGCGEDKTPVQMPPPQVKVVAIDRQEVIVEKDFVGQVFGYKDIPVRARVEGYLQAIAFEQGGLVNAGDMLYQIDPEPLQEALNAARSEMRQAQVYFERANNDLNRIAPLAKINAVSQRDYDAAIAEKEASAAVVDAARAKVRLAEIQLGYARIKAPIDGIIGKTMADVGEFVGRSPNPVILNTISAIDSVRVEFFLTERDYLKFAKQLAKDTASRGHTPLKLILADGEQLPEAGRVKFVNREVDAATGAILVQAVFPNPGRLVRPGQFARVRAAVETIPDALLVPQRCVQEVQGSFSVLQPDAEGKVKQVSIDCGPSYRDYFIVRSGLEAGDKVIFEGLQKAGAGAVVTAEEIEFESQFGKQ